MSAPLTIYRKDSRRFQAFVWVFLVAMALVAVRIDHWLPRVIGIVLLMAAIPAAFFMETYIDMKSGHVVRTTRLFGLIPTRRREVPISDFSGIQCLCSSKATTADDFYDTWVVTLRPRSGRAIELRQFKVPTGERCLEATAFARELSQLTGLEIFDDEV